MRFSLLICAMLVALAPAQTGAHAFLDHADPRVGSTVQAAPAEVRIWFTQEIEGAFSTVNVRDAKGERVNKADSRVDSGDHTLLRVPLETLAPGVYTVAWRVVSVDTHVTEGDFVFTVGK
jgi:methionine-rich copper-binding protein CopC